jgi:branched-chain amino acid transport system ATP-binding protein
VSPRLECRQLTGGRGSTVVFRKIDLAVESGTIRALLGANGAGKSTLLLTIAGLLPQRGGTVVVDGEPLKPGRPTAASRAGVVLVPDNRSLFSTLTVEENLRAGAHKGGPAPLEMLDGFPALKRRARLRAGSLSGGEQQMLAIARALIQQPKVLLIDEMSLGLAPRVVRSLFDTVRRSADEHRCAIVLVEQHVNLALQVADSASVLNRGEIVLQGSAAELRAEPGRLEQAYFGTVDGAVS